MKNFLCVILGFVICGSILQCSLFEGDKQPLVSQSRESLERFNKTTSFPYEAIAERREAIISNRKKLHVGMSGDEVLEVMGKPDEITTNSFVGGPIKGWFWDYNIYKKFERAPDDSDQNIHIYFGLDGKVRDVSEHSSK